MDDALNDAFGVPEKETVEKTDESQSVEQPTQDLAQDDVTGLASQYTEMKAEVDRVEKEKETKRLAQQEADKKNKEAVENKKKKEEQDKKDKVLKEIQEKEKEE